MMKPYKEKDYFFNSVIGIDEVGRGPLAGPVVACSVLVNDFNNDFLKSMKSLNITDSKKVSERKRSQILKALEINVLSLKLDKSYQVGSFYFVISEVSAQEIDEINILQSSLKAMRISCRRLLKSVKGNELKILIDGNKSFTPFTRNENKNHFDKTLLKPIIKGDSKSLAIGLASIIAKEYRDNLMNLINEQYPLYEFSQNKGYPTAKHKALIKKYGVSDVHRKSFRGVKEHL